LRGKARARDFLPDQPHHQHLVRNYPLKGSEAQFLTGCSVGPCSTLKYNVILGWGGGPGLRPPHPILILHYIHEYLLSGGGRWKGRGEAALPFPTFPPRAKYSCINWLGRRKVLFFLLPTTNLFTGIL